MTLRFVVLMSGDTSRKCVRDGNKDALRLTILLLYARLVGAHFVVEQPMSSLLAYCDFLQRLFEKLAVERLVTYLGAFGGDTCKPVKLYFDLPWVMELKKAKPHGLLKCAVQRGGKVHGLKHIMQQSAVYPEQFGLEVASCAVAVLSKQ